MVNTSSQKFDLYNYHKHDLKLFNKRILDRLNVVYHGTTNRFEDEIDSNGFKFHQLIEWDKVSALTDCYKNNNLVYWKAPQHSGFEILDSYSTVKIKYGNNRKLYFKVLPSETSLYCSKKFAGGEIVQSSLRTYENMKYFYTNAETQLPILQNNLSIQRKQAPPVLKESFASPDLGKIKDTLEVLESTYNRFNRIINKFKYGLIYAVRIPKDTYGRAETGHCEVALEGKLKRENIVKKVRVENGCKRSKSSQLLEMGRLLRWKEFLS
jgi:hypothetical protein